MNPKKKITFPFNKEILDMYQSIKTAILLTFSYFYYNLLVLWHFSSQFSAIFIRNISNIF